MFDPKPTDLSGAVVRLVPLAEEHADDLFEAGGDEESWGYMPHPAFQVQADAAGFIQSALGAARDGSQLPFAITMRADGRAIGSTRFLDIQRSDRGLEIGWTWIGRAWQRGPVNTECKRLLLTHAFEQLGAMRVALKTDSRNQRSRTAIERIGGKFEGILRKHRACWDGSTRDSAYYSIIDDEWPDVKAQLTALQARGSNAESR